MAFRQMARSEANVESCGDGNAGSEWRKKCPYGTVRVPLNVLLMSFLPAHLDDDNDHGPSFSSGPARLCGPVTRTVPLGCLVSPLRVHDVRPLCGTKSNMAKRMTVRPGRRHSSCSPGWLPLWLLFLLPLIGHDGLILRSFGSSLVAMALLPRWEYYSQRRRRNISFRQLLFPWSAPSRTQYPPFNALQSPAYDPEDKRRRPYRPAEEEAQLTEPSLELETATLTLVATDRPTDTLTQPSPIPAPDKTPRRRVVVLGATGRIGRLVVRHLMDSNTPEPLTIVAVCRDYDKAFRVLLDDMLAAKVPVKGAANQGPRLKIVQTPVVPPQLDPYDAPTMYRELEKFMAALNETEASLSTTPPWNTSTSNIPSANTTRHAYDVTMHALYPLAEAMRGASVVINCIGTTTSLANIVTQPRATLQRLGRDLLPWRLLRVPWRGNGPQQRWNPDDASHPYLVHYVANRVALLLAEREEQQRRRRIAEVLNHTNGEPVEEPMVTNLTNITSGNTTWISSNQSTTMVPTELQSFRSRRDKDILKHQKDRVRFVRISDLTVTQAPWQLVPIVTNLFHSMVLRYQEMAEVSLSQSRWLDTIVLRPGDLVSWQDDDEDGSGERDMNTTAVQVGTRGWVSQPARIGRDDVAALAVAAALFKKKNQSSTAMDGKKMIQTQRPSSRQSVSEHDMDLPPFHYKLACRWVGSDLHPYPPQGVMSDGHVDAQVAMETALQKLMARSARRRGYQARWGNSTNATSVSSFRSVKGRGRHHQLKPYGLCVAIPTYLVLFLLASRIVQLVLAVCLKSPLLQPATQLVGGQPWLEWVGTGAASVGKALFGMFWRGASSKPQYISF